MLGPVHVDALNDAVTWPDTGIGGLTASHLAGSPQEPHQQQADCEQHAHARHWTQRMHSHACDTRPGHGGHLLAALQQNV